MKFLISMFLLCLLAGWPVMLIAGILGAALGFWPSVGVAALILIVKTIL